MERKHRRSDVDEMFEFPIEGTNHSIQIDHKRSADHDHGVVHDIGILTRAPGGGCTSIIEVDGEHWREFVQALIDAGHVHQKWLREGTNWNLGAEGV